MSNAASRSEGKANGAAAGQVAEPAKLPVRAAGFPDLWWPVGTRVQLVFNRSGQDRLASSALIGYALGEYLIVRTPLERELPMLFEPGDTMRLRAFVGTSVGEFDTEVERVFRAPMWYLHLRYPREVRIQKLRAAPRVRVDLAVRLKIGDQPEVPARLADLSAHGAQLMVAGITIEKGSTLSMAFVIDGDEPDTVFELSTSAKVMTARQVSQPIGEARGAPTRTSGDGPWSLGLRFEALDPSDRLKIANYVYQRLLAGGG